MSLNAYRYTNPERVVDIGERRKLGDPNKMTWHHTPPRHPEKAPRKIKLDEKRHRAYHIALGNPATFHDAIENLRLTYWPMIPKGRYCNE